MITVSIFGVPETLQKLLLLQAAIGEAGAHEAVVGTNITYAPYVHNGTAPHDIRPLNKKALFWPGAAHPVTLVHHPGYKGNPFLTSALDDSKSEIVLALQAAVNQAISGGGGSAMRAGLSEAGFLVEAKAKARVNVRTGTLRRSITTEVR